MITTQTATPTATQAAYFDLLKRALLDTLYVTPEYRPLRDGGRVFRLVNRYLRWRRMVACKELTALVDKRQDGSDWLPGRALSMVGMQRLNNLQTCIETVIADGIPGDLIETGVWRGGSTILMQAILKAYGEEHRSVWVADSFEGLPKPNDALYPADRGDELHAVNELAVSLEEVQDNFRRFGCLDPNVRFLKGWFKDTLPHAPIDRLAVLRLDGDMYESTMDAIAALYPKLSPGGFCIVDDYGCMPSCKQAVHDYRAAHGISEPILQIDKDGVYWRRHR